MTTIELLEKLRGLRVVLSADGDRLRCSAPRNVLDEHLRAEIARRKAELLALLPREPFHSPAPRGDAEPSLQPVPRTGPKHYPLSSVQRRLWFFEQLTPGTAVLHMCFSVRLQGAVDVRALELALDQLQRRHAALRTVFRTQDDTPAQHVLPPSPFTLSQQDLRGESALSVADVSTQLGEQPFDLANGPLWRAALLRTGDLEHVLALVAHHLVFDGTSAAIFIRELAELYAAAIDQRTATLSGLSWQYGDYATWETSNSAALDASLTYWRSRLAGPLPSSDLPTDYARPAVQTFHGAAATVSVPPAVVNRLQALGRAHNATLFMVLLASFKALLVRLTGQPDVIVGAPVAGRTRAELEHLIGVFINTVALRTDLGGNPTFIELIERVRVTAVEAYDHQEVPFDRVVAEVQPGRQLSQTPVFQVLFNMQEGGETAAFPMGNVRAEVEGRFDGGSKFDLTVYATRRRDQLELVFAYNADLFSPARIAHMTSEYLAILDQVVRDPSVPLSAVSLLTDDARAILPDPSAPLPREATPSIVSRLREHAVRTPDLVAVSDASGAYTYADLDRRSDVVAADLQALGLQPGEVVGLYCHRCRSFVVALLGVMKAGGAFSIFDPGHPADRTIECVRRAQPSIWLRIVGAPPEPEPLEHYLVSIGLVRLTVREEDAIEPVALRPFAHDPDRLAYVAFTSGSTGGVKAVAGSERPVAHFLQWHVSASAISAADTVSLLSGLGHDPLLRDIFTPLWTGGRLAIPTADEVRDPYLLAAFLARERITISHLTPPLASLLASALVARPMPLVLRRMFFGGDRLAVSLIDALRVAIPGASFVNFYGATETPQGIAFWTVPDVATVDRPLPASPALPVGRGIDGVQLLVLTSSGALAGIGEPGEICVRTPYLANGYRQDDELTSRRFVANPFRGDVADRMYRTGDLGRYNPAGDVEFIGRADFQVKVRGFRIELGEVELALSAHESVRQAAAIAYGSGTDVRLIAFVVPGTAAIDGAELRQFVRERLPEYMVPSAIVPLEVMPQTANGKLDRRALAHAAPGLLQSRPASTDAGDAPPTPIEDMVMAIWAEVLGVEHIGREDDFFELGGHSLLAVKLMKQLSDAFCVDLPVRMLFEAPTISAMSAPIVDRMEAKRREEARPVSTVAEINPQGSRPPFFFMHAATQGDGFYCYNLARHLGEDQPMYALPPLGLDGEPVPPTIELMAATQREIIRKVQPAGPYYLGGFCFAAVVALEVARQLRDEGERVELVVAIESRIHPPILLNRAANALVAGVGKLRGWSPRGQVATAIRLRPYVYAIAQLYYSDRTQLMRRLRTGISEARSRGIRKTLRNYLARRPAGAAPGPQPQSDPVRAAVRKANNLAVNGYVPRRYDGRIEVMWAEAEPFEPRWWRMVGPDVRFTPVAGNHNTCVTTQVASLGGSLARTLREAQESVARRDGGSPAPRRLLRFRGSSAHPVFGLAAAECRSGHPIGASHTKATAR